jgi:pimeloyl-ACP methyl ester carboxylesterase
MTTTTSLSAQTWGNGSPLVLIHGVPGSSGVWSPVAERLAGDFHVIAPDLLGFGESNGEPGTDDLWADAQARALTELLDDMDIERAAIVGHDFGGPVALALTALRPELATRLVLCATNAFPDTPIPLPIRAVTWPLVGGPAAHLLFSAPSLRLMTRQAFAGEVPELDDSVWFGDSRQQRTVRTIFSTALRELPERYAAAERSVREVNCPSLAIWGAKDPFFPIELGRRTAEALPDGRFLLYEECGHHPPTECPGRFAADVAAFVRDPVTA